jgi:GTP-binding protein
MPRIPVLAIIGRPNVGKSSVFNRLAGKRLSIVHDMPGVTRDRLAAPAGSVKVPLTLMDTGGIGEAIDDGFAAQVEVEADIAMEEADLILFIVDAQSGLTPVDEFLAERLRKKRAPVILGVNKVDGQEHDSVGADFAKFGFEQTFTLSAVTGRGFGSLRGFLEQRFPAAAADEAGAGAPEEPLKIAIIGRPNVGKSSLVNAVLNDQRTIVSGIAGTTRDSIDIPFVKEGRPYLMIDTAGLRRRTKVDSLVEVFSVQRAKDSVRRADVCALVIDAGEGVTMQERKIAQFMLEAHKPCIIVANKFDLYHAEAKFRDRLEELEETLRREFFFMPYAPIVAVSAKDREHLGRVFSTIEKIRTASETMPGTGVLNRLIHEAIERTLPPAIRGKRLKLLYSTLQRPAEPQVVTAPTIVTFVNYADLMSDSYQRYLEAQIREQFPFEGLPLRFEVRERRREEKPGPAGRRASKKARERGKKDQARTTARPAKDPRRAAAKAAGSIRKPAPARRGKGRGQG